MEPTGFLPISVMISSRLPTPVPPPLSLAVHSLSREEGDHCSPLPDLPRRPACTPVEDSHSHRKVLQTCSVSLDVLFCYRGRKRGPVRRSVLMLLATAHPASTRPGALRAPGGSAASNRGWRHPVRCLCVAEDDRGRSAPGLAGALRGPGRAAGCRVGLRGGFPEVENSLLTARLRRGLGPVTRPVRRRSSRAATARRGLQAVEDLGHLTAEGGFALAAPA